MVNNEQVCWDDNDSSNDDNSQNEDFDGTDSKMI